MKARTVIVVCGLAAAGLVGAFLLARSPENPPILPLPASLRKTGGEFVLPREFPILVRADAAQSAAERLRLRLVPDATPRLLHGAAAKDGSPGRDAIIFEPAEALPREAYQLSIKPEQIVIRGSQPAGFHYATETLLQLVTVTRRGKRTLPCLEINDAPRFAWRGLMMDVSRHFFTPEEVEKTLDAMSARKLNTFHWHLTDDEGWRLEIKGDPALTAIGAWRPDIGFGLAPTSSSAYNAQRQYGGFYTQAQVSEVVRYAADLQITIVPEIELPSHAGAALNAHPELLCEGKPYSPRTGEGLIPTVFCAGKEQTFEFLERVLGQVMDLFPGKYVHIGGDEVPLRNWSQCPQCRERMRTEGLGSVRQLQTYFMARVARIVTSHGRIPVVWSEAMAAGLPSETVLMDWTGGAENAARAGHNVVRSPIRYTYLNLYQSRDREGEPRAIGGLLTLEMVYSFDPVPANLPDGLGSKVLGVQANLWTEYIPNMEIARHMLFPRLTALAEVAWTPSDRRDWRDFEERLNRQSPTQVFP